MDIAQVVGPSAAIAAAIAVIVEILKRARWTADLLAGDMPIVAAFLLGPLLALGAWTLGVVDADGWRAAVALGLWSAVGACGGYDALVAFGGRVLKIHGEVGNADPPAA